MAFAVTAFKTYSVAAFEAVTAQFEQVAEFTITRGASDIDLDIGDSREGSQHPVDSRATNHKRIGSVL